MDFWSFSKSLLWTSLSWQLRHNLWCHCAQLSIGYVQIDRAVVELGVTKWRSNSNVVHLDQFFMLISKMWGNQAVSVQGTQEGRFWVNFGHFWSKMDNRLVWRQNKGPKPPKYSIYRKNDHSFRICRFNEPFLCDFLEIFNFCPKIQFFANFSENLRPKMTFYTVCQNHNFIIWY